MSTVALTTKASNRGLSFPPVIAPNAEHSPSVDCSTLLFGRHRFPRAGRQSFERLSAIPEFQELSRSDPASAKAFFRVFSRTTPAGQEMLLGLLERTDSRPHIHSLARDERSLIEGLDALRSSSFLNRTWQKADKKSVFLDRGSLIENILREVIEPGDAFQGSGRAICPAESLAFAHSSLMPADFVRTLVSLFNNRSAAMAVGTLKAPLDALHRDFLDERSTTRALMQAAYLNSGLHGLGYSNSTDCVVSLESGRNLGSGASNQEIMNLLEKVTGIAHRRIKTRPQIVAWLQKNPEAAVFAGARWRDGSDGMHSIVIQSCRDSLITFRNPWGNFLLQLEGSEGTIPGAKILNKRLGTESIPLEALLDRELDLLVPISARSVCARLRRTLLKLGFSRVGSSDCLYRAGFLAKLDSTSRPALQLYTSILRPNAGFPRAIGLHPTSSTFEIVYKGGTDAFGHVLAADELCVTGKERQKLPSKMPRWELTDSRTEVQLRAKLAELEFVPISEDQANGKRFFSSPHWPFVIAARGTQVVDVLGGKLDDINIGESATFHSFRSVETPRRIFGELVLTSFGRTFKIFGGESR